MQQRSASAGGGLGGDLDYRASHESVSLRFRDTPDPLTHAPELPNSDSRSTPAKIRNETPVPGDPFQ